VIFCLRLAAKTGNAMSLCFTWGPCESLSQVCMVGYIKLNIYIALFCATVETERDMGADTIQDYLISKHIVCISM
jgi:hypothetical protein